jgi:hypothetical protein
MFVLNDNDQSKKHGRYLDVNHEPLTMLTPIRDYDKIPLVEIMEPLIPYIPEIQQMADIAKNRCERPPAYNLSADQSAAIILCTLE